MKVIRTNKPLKLDNGDIDVYGLDKWLTPIDEVKGREAKAIIALDVVSLNPWRALQRMGIDAEELKASCTYTCPITDREYTACVPDHIVTRDPTPYMEPIPNHYREMTEDLDWMRNHVLDDVYNRTSRAMWYDRHVNKLLACLIGPGYTHYISAWDGSNSVEVAAVELDNGDEIVCHHLVWYNK